MITMVSLKACSGRAIIAISAEVERRFQMALAHHRAGRTAEAEAGYVRVLAMTPAHYAGLQNLGILHAQQGRVDEALTVLRKAVAHHPKAAEGHSNLGVLLRSLGRHEEAVSSYERAIELQPGYADAYNNLGFALQLQNRLTEAETGYHQALALAPKHVVALGNLAYVQLLQRRYEEAVSLYRDVLDLQPDNADVLAYLGYGLHSQGRFDEAVQCLQHAIALKPDHAEAFNNLGNALAALGRSEEAILAYRRVLLLNPKYHIAPYNIGNALQHANRPAEALSWYEAALKLKPDYAEALHNMGSALIALERHAEAMDWYKKAIAVAPGYVDAWCNLGVAFQALDRFDEAEEAYLRALALDPRHAEAWNNMSLVQQFGGDPLGAAESCRRALAIRPAYPDALNNLGIALETLGRIDEARQAFEQALDLRPLSGKYFRNLTETLTFEPGAPQIARGAVLSEKIASLSPDDRMELLFGLGKMRADLKDYGAAVEDFIAANQLKRQKLHYNEAATFKFFRDVRNAIGAEAMARGDVGYSSPVPVFILGMPRSGSTLVEQILASHSGIFGAGELRDFSEVLAKVLGHDPPRTPAPDRLAAMTESELRAIGRAYLEGLTAREPGALRITDKMPSNFIYAGLIHLALPGARIIHTRRDPLDTCVSCYSKLFVGAQPYAYEMGELGRYYRAYLEQMEHWRRVLPAGVMLEIDYETLVADPEGQARRILAHVGMPWEDACLAFHKTERPVLTASAAQVRQPIYRSAVGRWRTAAALLAPLIQALGI